MNLGSKTGDSDGMTYDANVNAYITTGVGGAALSGRYCSATKISATGAWIFNGDYWDDSSLTQSRSVRPVLGF